MADEETKSNLALLATAAAQDEKGPANTLRNATWMIGQIPELELWFDEFHQRLFIKWGKEPVHEWRDVDALNVTLYLQKELGFKASQDGMIHKAAQVIGHKNVRNELREWMESVTWDEQERISKFFVDCLGAPDNAYVKKASRNFLIAMAARTFKPGCKVDNMIILEGNQGNKKSTALRELVGGKFHAEINESPDNKDFAMALAGKLIAEIAELSSFTKSEVAAVKRIITSEVDRYRPPYGRTTQDFPRRCVLVGSTNDEHYLRDTTGNRRFWPIKCGKIDIELIRKNRDQLFAEAVDAFKGGATWWEMPEKDTLDEQEARRLDDPWEALIADWLDGASFTTVVDGKVINVSRKPDDPTTTQQILDLCLNIRTERRDVGSQMRVAKILKMLGWGQYREGTDRSRMWKRK